ncbi:hypothetical protein HYALB_00007481 [Hymenoscyphus albidus]|uniref:C6 zinc finger domain protein n=1 Tax=Hymenoscyphus albidus TaxID=595503 RepID=A0A9N9Q412_9HELO|nr:hypothetical protein HYALB_00007481 [Hymenoscyphus albidus]
MASPVEQRNWEIFYLRFSYSEPVVWHSLLSIASLMEGYTLRAHPKAAVAHQLALWHYNKAVGFLIPQKSAEMVKIEVLLSCCYLFYALETNLQNTDEAFNHLYGGYQIIRVWRANHKNPISLVETVFCPLFYTQTFSWLSNWFTYFKELRVKVDMNDLHPLPRGGFTGLSDASVELFQITCYGLGCARSFETYKVTHDIQEDDEAARLQREYFRSRLEHWLEAFERLYPQGCPDTAKALEIKYLKLIRRIVYLCLPGRFNVVGIHYDAYANGFASIVDEMTFIYDTAAKEFEKYQKTNSTSYYFRENIFLHVYMISIKCRNPSVRRKALSLLEKVASPQSIWNNLLSIAMIERLIQVEEEGLEGVVDATGSTVPSEWARIHDITRVPEDVPHPDGFLFRMRQKINGEWCIRDERISLNVVQGTTVTNNDKR